MKWSTQQNWRLSTEFVLINQTGAGKTTFPRSWWLFNYWRENTEVIHTSRNSKEQNNLLNSFSSHPSLYLRWPLARLSLCQPLSCQHKVIVWSGRWCHFLHKQVQLPPEGPYQLSLSCSPAGVELIPESTPPTKLNVITFYSLAWRLERTFAVCCKSI